MTNRSSNRIEAMTTTQLHLGNRDTTRLHNGCVNGVDVPACAVCARGGPSVQQQTQREREKEAIFRGEQVADAIRSYYIYRGGQGPNSLPTDIDQLLEGIQIPGRTKKLQILRSEAAVDPLSQDGEWRRIGATSDEFRGFVQALMEYSGGVAPQPRREFTSMASLIPQLTNVLNTSSEEGAPVEKTLQQTPPDHSSASQVAVSATL
jgi:hypothetical protein